MTREFARRLRKQLTEAEKRLWRRLRGKQIAGCKFRRQHPLGPYIVDFACIERGLVVELDGGQHMDREKEDAERTRCIEQNGFSVLRFWDNKVFEELDAVVEAIRLALQ